MTTTQALDKLTSGHAQQVWLVKPGSFTAVVRFDRVQKVLLIKSRKPEQPLCIHDVLFQTHPVVVL